MQRFQQQVAIVTGAARGIGKGVAMRLAREGARVFAWDINKDELVAMVTECQMEGLPLSGALVDITSESQLTKAYEDVVKHTGKLDILINCAGIVGPNGIKTADYGLEDFERVIRTNLTGAFLATKYALPYMLTNQYGRIVHISSIGGKEGNPNMVGYAASKSGLMGLVKGVGKEYADTGITINAIAPAVILTEMNRDTSPEMMAYMKAKIPMGRLGTVEEVAAMACWIASMEASFNTGFVFDLSGGRATY